MPRSGTVHRVPLRPARFAVPFGILNLNQQRGQVTDIGVPVTARPAVTKPQGTQPDKRLAGVCSTTVHTRVSFCHAGNAPAQKQKND